MQNYFLNINKPQGITSFDVIYKLRKALNIKKIGHAGTLDPLATGVLPIGVAGGAKLLEYLDDDKVYRAKITFGYNSTTYDIEGEKTFISKPNFNEDELKSALSSFMGKINQIPPAYSAVKIGGKKLYELARAGKNIPEIKPRPVEIYDIKLVSYNAPHLAPDTAEIYVHCSKGTYIRSIVFDLGQKLGCGAYMSALVREKSGGFNIEDSISLDDDFSVHKIYPQDVLKLNKYFLNDEQFKRVVNGNPIIADLEKQNDKKFMLIYNNQLVSIANLAHNKFVVEKVFKSE